MDLALLAVLRAHEFLYALPLVVAVSLVYASTRHEAMGPIVRHAMGCGAWIVGLMAAAAGVLLWLSS